VKDPLATELVYMHRGGNHGGGSDPQRQVAALRGLEHTETGGSGTSASKKGGARESEAELKNVVGE